MLDSCALLSSMVEERLKELVKPKNGIDIEVHTSNCRAVRGYSIVAATSDDPFLERRDDRESRFRGAERHPTRTRDSAGIASALHTVAECL
jgi:hypothetical protein